MARGQEYFEAGPGGTSARGARPNDRLPTARAWSARCGGVPRGISSGPFPRTERRRRSGQNRGWGGKRTRSRSPPHVPAEPSPTAGARTHARPRSAEHVAVDEAEAHLPPRGIPGSGKHQLEHQMGVSRGFLVQGDRVAEVRSTTMLPPGSPHRRPASSYHSNFNTPLT